MSLRCVFFDLDGTLVDTAPDLIYCLNYALTAKGFAKADSVTVKPFISFGSRAMIKASLPSDGRNPQIETDLLSTMLDCYQNHIAEGSALVAGIDDTLNRIESSGLKWGVVTNKQARFTLPLLDSLKLTSRAASIISGDTTPFSKPHPEPMLTACKEANVAPEQCVYIGDARHDIDAGKNAKMKTLAARYGYLLPDEKPESWGADAVIDAPIQITEWIGAQGCH